MRQIRPLTLHVQVVHAWSVRFCGRFLLHFNIQIHPPSISIVLVVQGLKINSPHARPIPFLDIIFWEAHGGAFSSTQQIIVRGKLLCAVGRGLALGLTRLSCGCVVRGSTVSRAGTVFFCLPLPAQSR